jgi:hypothetical protein
VTGAPRSEGRLAGIIEVPMFGRRSHSRFAVLPRPEGLLRVMSDVTVERSTDRHEEVTAITRESGVVGQSIVVEIPQDSVRVEMVVVESRPVIVSGAVRHRVRMQRADSASAADRLDILSTP